MACGEVFAKLSARGQLYKLSSKRLFSIKSDKYKVNVWYLFVLLVQCIMTPKTLEGLFKELIISSKD